MRAPSSSFDTESSPGEGLSFQKIFELQNNLNILLSTSFHIIAVTNAYEQETFISREQAIGKSVFEVFPDNPEVGREGSSGKLKASLEQALTSKQPCQVELIRYDITDPAMPGRFIERYWSVVNTPILNEKGEVTRILHEAKNITEAEKAKKDLQESEDREKIALAQVEQQRLRLERLFAQVPAAMAILEGPDLEFKEINDAYQHLFPGRKLLGLPLFEALSELKGQPIEDIVEHVITTGETFEGKEILIPLARHEGQPLEDIYWNFIYQALYDAQGKINGMFIFALDVTPFVEARQQVEKSAEELKALNQELEARVERRTRDVQKAQAEAERQRQRLERLFMNAPSAICILSGPELVYELVNPVYAGLFPDRKLLGKPILEALPEIKDNKVYRTFREVYATGITHEEPELLIPFKSPEGLWEDRYFRFIQQARTNEEGKIDGVLVFAIEVTEQVIARKAVEETANNLRLITDSLPVLIGYLDRDRVYRFTNKAYESWFPIKSEDLLGRKVLDVVGEEAYNATKGYMDRALAGERLSFEATMPYREDFVKHIKTDYVPDVRDGQVLGFYTLVTDVTEQVEARKRMERSSEEARGLAQELAGTNEDLRLANQQLTHTNKDLDNFIYTASHDLKAPISNIEMLLKELQVELPQESLQESEVQAIIKMMQNSIDRFKKTIASLTEITKLQKDHDQAAQTVNLKTMVQEVQLDMQQSILASGARLEVNLREDAQVSFAEKNLRSVVYNLLSNAIKYRHPERSPVVRVSCEPEDAYVVLIVQDNGLGINPKQQHKLFTMFSRFHDHVEGSGVGLYMVKRILDNAEGKIEVQSAVGVGSTFKVYLKRAV
ncbi:PAS domain-containing protein [Nibribacter ruber]|uniref:histidine kinase n=1 Tax=Nibribacter ruber TaxID=2698458 RepID=A0A6P1NZL9_9BACT|nr:PAS domain-containing protein [Nibribacter ruber]QHL87625.1 PAS domain-containing protein [Nibribacter ruber]